jgi:uncharacterized protein YecT (DUF1311 family)
MSNLRQELLHARTKILRQIDILQSCIDSGEPIFGLASLTGNLEGKGDGPDLDGLAIRLDEHDRQLYAGIVIAQIASMKMVPGQESLRAAEEPQPYELTSRGNIARSATEAYKSAIESCYRGTTGNQPHGPQFIACLQQQIRREAAELDAVYSGTISYLRSSPDQIARLRQAQRAWLQFQNENCAFARAAAPRGYADEFLLHVRGVSGAF